MADLLPCPFCGSRNVAQGASGDRISVWCFCGARGPDAAFPQDCIDPVTPIKECHAAWNRRASPSQVERIAADVVRDALEAAKELAETVEELTGCRADDDYVWGVQEKIAAALASLAPQGGEGAE